MQATVSVVYFWHYLMGHCYFHLNKIWSILEYVVDKNFSHAYQNQKIFCMVRVNFFYQDIHYTTGCVISLWHFWFSLKWHSNVLNIQKPDVFIITKTHILIWNISWGQLILFLLSKLIEIEKVNFNHFFICFSRLIDLLVKPFFSFVYVRKANIWSF